MTPLPSTGDAVHEVEHVPTCACEIAEHVAGKAALQPVVNPSRVPVESTAHSRWFGVSTTGSSATVPGEL
jgi:hypothetical protein